ncbi:hypothetical protein BL253_22235 [Pseudofrankia asymbiotica]|uniref:Uncharacterized protein n=1 Tax=Pseudofrankia asymbiotica TaxID=1834516 RepID=A0A1V2I8U9_9ACTN|nr:hypothetical protein BL253_22235 [Pseudofrankia asymbiotica]
MTEVGRWRLASAALLATSRIMVATACAPGPRPTAKIHASRSVPGGSSRSYRRVRLTQGALMGKAKWAARKAKPSQTRLMSSESTPKAASRKKRAATRASMIYRYPLIVE